MAVDFQARTTTFWPKFKCTLTFCLFLGIFLLFEEFPEYFLAVWTIGLLICTLISENQGLEKSRSVSKLRKISVPANLDFFLGLHLAKKLDLYTVGRK